MIIIMSVPTILQNVQEVHAETSVFYPYDSGIVYMLPSEASTPYWMETYGDRTAFYIYSNVSLYKNEILKDFDAISRYYRFIVRILPIDDTAFFYYNLRLMDSWAAEKSLKVLYAFFPKSKYGPQESYLVAGTTVHERLIHDMQFVENLSATTAVAVWYGWEGIHLNVQEVEDFYNSLSQDLRRLYCVWLDGSFAEDAAAAGLSKVVDPLNITVVTELYSVDFLSQYGFAFKRQIIVSGSSGDQSINEWQDAMTEKLNLVRASPDLSNYSLRRLVVWTFWDRDDGSDEEYTAYLNGTLSNPLLTSIPTQVLLDQASPKNVRVNVGSVVSFRYHFSWPDGFNATDVVVNINETECRTDTNGWATFTASNNRVEKLALFPDSVNWGPYALKVTTHTEVPEIVFDKVLIELFTNPDHVETETNNTIVARGIYEYDGTPFQGNIALNRTMDHAQTGTYIYVATRINDTLYGLTVFDSHVLTATNENPARVADQTHLVVLLVAASACFIVWMARKHHTLEGKSIR